jgi:hypothetical protein
LGDYGKTMTNKGAFHTNILTGQKYIDGEIDKKVVQF